jgi:hypothetical protein
MLVPFRTIRQNTSTKHIFNDLIDSFSLSISLEMISCTSDDMGAQTLMQLLSKVSNKNRSSIGDDGLRDAVIADNVWYVELGILSDSVCSGYGYEVGRLSQAVYDDPYRVVPTWGARQTHNEVHVDVFPLSTENFSLDLDTSCWSPDEYNTMSNELCPWSCSEAQSPSEPRDGPWTIEFHRHLVGSIRLLPTLVFGGDDPFQRPFFRQQWCLLWWLE